jgi:glycosyltransferase involved in cell wall biosynthesis
MITAALMVAAFSYAVVLSVYILYFVFVLRNRKIKEYIHLMDQTMAKPFVFEDLPNVTAIIPAFNEGKVISRKLQNLAELEYPMEKVEILLIDDFSTDETYEIAENAFKNLGLRGKIIRNVQRMGANACYNNGVPNASSNLILRTDADVMIEPRALFRAVEIISHIENVGGVTGTMVPVGDRSSVATAIEKSYRGLFDLMSTAESALHSTFSGGGGFVLIKKSVFSPIPVDRGSTDANISLSVIRKGHRFVYIPEAFSIEPISTEIKDQARRKMRRASRLIQSTIMNKDVLFDKKYREFGTTVFPLRFLMFVVCPLLTFVGILATVLFTLSYSVVLAGLLVVVACLLFFAGTKIKVSLLNYVASLVMQQSYLLLGLLLAGKRTKTWNSVNRPVLADR